MKFCKIENNYNYTAKCPYCPSLLKFNIDTNNLIINGECKNGHIFEDISTSQMIDFIKNTYLCKYYCNKCQTIINEENQNYICSQCNKLFCSFCLSKHYKEKGHKSANFFNNNFSHCTLHNIKNTLFCENCKIHICEECKNAHDSHSIINFIGIIYNKKKKAINSQIDEYKKKISNLIQFISKKKEELDKRFNQLKDFLNCLLYINEKLLMKFNYSVFDYYNFHNFNIFYEYQKNEFSLDESKNLDYLFFGPNLNDIKLKKSFKIEKNIKEEKFIHKGIDNFNICNFKNLKYLKENIFFIYEQKDGKTFIKFFVSKNFSFKLYFEKMLGNCDKIENIKIGKYNNLFVITRGKRIKIFVIKYDIEKKDASLEKIYDPYHKINFNDIIDIKNDNYVVTESKGLKIFFNFYKPENIIKNIKENYNLINNINDLIFIALDSYSNFHFFNSVNYEKIKIINFPVGFKYASNIENKILIFTQKFGLFFFVDIKNLEIIQKMDYLKTNKKIAINNNGLYEFLFGNGKIEIKKYNFIDGCFEFYGLAKVESLQNNFNQNNIKFLDNKFLYFADDDELEILNF